MKVLFYSLGIYDLKLEFVVIQARYHGKWIFARHKDRSSWEISGGHIEKDEDPDDCLFTAHERLTR